MRLQHSLDFAEAQVFRTLYSLDNEEVRQFKKKLFYDTIR
jgi:hypothetical protein